MLREFAILGVVGHILLACDVEKSTVPTVGLDTGVQDLDSDPPTDIDPGTDDDTPTWRSNIAADTLPVEVSWGTLPSSSRLSVTWDSFASAAAYEVTAEVGAHAITEVVDPDVHTAVLHGLRSDTTYLVTVAACEDPACWRSSVSDSVEAGTAPMAWQVVGEGSSFASADPVIEDGDTKGFGLYYGDDAPIGMAGTIQLFYDSSDPDRKGVNLATANEPMEGVTDLLAFSGTDATCLHRDSSVTGTAMGPTSHQAVPLKGGGIRIFFEGELSGETASRLYAIDSQDGDRGQDYNPGADIYCYADDIAMGGVCEPMLVLGTEEDGYPGVQEVRQSKLVFPMFDEWRWERSRGSAILTTIHFTEDMKDCSSTHFNMGMAVWDGARWALSYDDETGCPQTSPGIQAPMPVHMGDGRYMVMFSANVETGPSTSATKPLYVLYADTAASGDPDRLEWSDFEERWEAREVHTYWPSGIEIPDVMERKLDDFGIFSPTGEADNLVMYANMSCGDASCTPLIGQLGWVNP